jgi:hypothetical protein
VNLTTILVLVGAYLLLTRQAPQRVATQPAQPTGGQITTTPEGTRITIPGIGSYVNIGGGQVTQITLDPNLFGNLFGGLFGPQPVAAQPAPADYGVLPQPTDPTDWWWA